MNRTAVTALIGDVAAIALGSFLTVTVLTSTATARSTTTRRSASSLSTAPSAHSTATAASGGAAISNPTPVPPATPATPAAPVVVAPLRVLTIGDLIMNGFGLNRADAWPELRSTANGWHLTSLACDGAGFLTPDSPDECGQPNPQLLAATPTKRRRTPHHHRTASLSHRHPDSHHHRPTRKRPAARTGTETQDQVPLG